MLLITVTKKTYVMSIIHIWPITSPFKKVSIGTENTMYKKNQVYYTALVEKWQEMRDSNAANVLAKSPDLPSAGDQKIQSNRR